MGLTNYSEHISLNQQDWHLMGCTFLLLEVSLSRLNEIVTTMRVYPENMKKNLNLLGGLHNSQKLLLKLTQKGLSRQEAYSIVQKNAMIAWDNSKNFEDVLKKDKTLLKKITKQEIKKMVLLVTRPAYLWLKI